MSSKERMKAAFSGMAYPTYEGREAVHKRQDRSRNELLIWLCATPVDLEALALLVKPFIQSGGVVHIGISPLAEGIIQFDWAAKCLRGAKLYKQLEAEQCKQLLKHCGCLLIPNLSQNMAAKLALGIQDQPGLVLTWAALGLGIRVEAVTQQLWAPSYAEGGFEATLGQRQILQRHLRGLEALGISTYLQLSDLRAAWEQAGKYSLSALAKGKFKAETFVELKDALGLKVITERHILNLERGCRLKIERGAKVTPLAKDAAKQRQIELLRKD